MVDYRKTVTEDVYEPQTDSTVSETFANKSAAYAELGSYCQNCNMALRKGDASEGDWCPRCGEVKLVHYYAE